MNKFLIIIVITFLGTLFFIKYISHNTKEPFELPNIVKPRNYDVDDKSISSHESYLRNNETHDDPERDMIDTYRRNFFSFGDRVNNSSHLNDPVDNLNITNNANDFNVGANIADIYDTIVNTNNYKDGNNSMCKNIRK